jgi:hypothetical protein
MGPILIFDKSFLQALNPDEAVWLDQFFLTNITPVFFIETLADLEKEVHKGRTPEQIVGNLAAKTPDLHSRPNMHHRSLLAGELARGDRIEMSVGRPIISGGRHTELEGRSGVVFETAPEEEALNRWQAGRFLDLERQQAKAWRRDLSLISPERQREMLSGWFGSARPRSLEQIKALTDAVIDNNNREETFVFGMALLGIAPVAQGEVLERWRRAGQPPLGVFAPYFRHLFGVDLFFYLGLSSDLISSRRTNKIDLAYLYYLPFCMVFTSSDKLHAATVPLFMRSNQTFVPGPELKADLGALDRHFDSLSEEVKLRGVYAFASRPPVDSAFLVTRLWDQHMSPRWREHAMRAPTPRNPERQAALVELIKKQAAAPASGDETKSADELDYMIITRRVRLKKGKWKRFPPEVKPDP